MTEFEKAKEHYHHKEYQKAIDMILNLIDNNTVTNSSIEYPDILTYLGASRLGLYEISKNKSLVYEALTDFATGANALLVFHQQPSCMTDLKNVLY